MGWKMIDADCYRNKARMLKMDSTVRVEMYAAAHGWNNN